jgi:hypothetical protein
MTGHNPYRLIVRKLIKVTNASHADKLLGRFCESKHGRGYRLRYVCDHITNTIELGGRLALNVDMAIRRLKEAKVFVDYTTFRDNPLLNRC